MEYLLKQKDFAKVVPEFLELNIQIKLNEISN